MVTTSYYFDFNFPLKVVQLILNLIFGAPSPNNPTPSVDPATREWFSQPRLGSDPTAEVITTVFKLPLSVSELTLEVLRMPCVVECWYLDRQNNWRQILDAQRIPVRFGVSRSEVKSFYKYHTSIYPIVAKQLQFRLRRNDDPTLAGVAFVLGLRNCLIRRNVYDRNAATSTFEDEQDVFGNVITKYIKDWDATKAIDDEPTTYWKSEPMPDPHAVCSLYLDVRGDDGGPKNIDKLYLDPVYTGQHLNLYYSNDDTVTTRKLSPLTVGSDSDENTNWRIGVGRTDIATGTGEAFYRFAFSIGPLNAQAAWIGVEWIPNFDPASGPATNPILLQVMNPTGPTFCPQLFYDVGAAEFVLEFDDGTTTRQYTAPCSQLFAKGEPVRIVAGWSYGPDTVYVRAVNRSGVVLASLDATPTDLPHSVSFDGTVQLYNWRGTFTAHIIKLEDFAVSSNAFLASPVYYVDPDPVIPDPQGRIPSTSLDNAVYAAPWTSSFHGMGGAHPTVFEDKEWTPIWRDYLSQKGMLYFPQAIAMKYLKLEFSQLTEEPYPIYDTGIAVKYRVFPISVSQQSSRGLNIEIGIGGFLGLGSYISVNNNVVNWLDPQSILTAVGSIFTPQIPPVAINTGTPFLTDTLPNDGAQTAIDDKRLELGSSYVYRRDPQDSYTLASTAISVDLKSDPIQSLVSQTPVAANDLQASTGSGLTSVVRSSPMLPVQADDWWVFPGQLAKLPATVMNALTNTSIVTTGKFTTEHRVRFNTTSVHRYEWRTLTRDATMAYFAGVREVTPYVSTFINGEDKLYFDFSSYDPTQWVWTNIQQIPAGPVSTAAALYRVEDPAFDDGLANWTPDPGNVAWSIDNSTGHWNRNAAKAVADGYDNGLTSSRLTVEEGTQVIFKVWVKWADLESIGAPITLGGVGYSGSAQVGTYIFASATIIDATSDWVQLSGTWTVPATINGVRVRLGVGIGATAGEVWFDTVTVQDGSADPTGVLFKALQTTSSFAKATVDFRDSGLLRSNAMWADVGQNTPSIGDEQLAYYVQTIPTTIPSGFWGDTIKAWGGDDVEWGTPFAVVSVSVDGNRRYQGRRVIHFTREAGTGEAGIMIHQWTHFMPQALFRIGAVVYKTLANGNQITVRLRRVSDGVIVYEQTLDPPTGRFWEFTTPFQEIPNIPDQDYWVELTLSGDAEDDLYLADLYCEIAPIRYFARLGGVGSPLIEVTDLRHSPNARAQVSTTDPVNQMSIQATILTPEAWAFGCRVTPTYLQ